MAIMWEAIQDFAKKHNIIVGACHAAPLDKARLMASPFVPFVSKDIEKRTNPAVILPGVQSVIVIGVGQRAEEHCSSNAFIPAGQLSSLGVEDDYHIRVKGLLRKLLDEIKDCLRANFKYKILVDSPSLDERALAHRAGLGFCGKNGLIISPEFGSRFNIGCLLTNIPLVDIIGRVDIRQGISAQDCIPGCSLCIGACPSGALKQNSTLDATRCISYLTQKDELSDQESVLIGNQLYGCDICQDICPFNASRPTAYINPVDWLNMDDETFTKLYGHTAMLWRGVKILKRNAKAVEDNIANVSQSRLL